MTTADELNALYARRAALEGERAAAAAAERDRIERENAHKRQLAAADVELARLEAQARRAEIALAVEHAAAHAADNAAAAAELRTATLALMAAIVEWLDTAAAPAQRAYEDTLRAIDRALAAAADTYTAETPWPTGEDYAALNARQQWNMARMSALGHTGEQLPTPLPPWAVVGEIAGHETDEPRRRAAHALYAALVGEFVTTLTDEYTADTHAKRHESARRARFVRARGGL